MFEVEAAKDGREHRVIGRAADVYLKWLAGAPTSLVFKLLYFEGSIPSTTVREEGLDPEAGLPFFVFKFLTFASAPKAHRNTKDLVNRAFDDETEKRHRMKTAAEALLVSDGPITG